MRALLSVGGQHFLTRFDTCAIRHYFETRDAGFRPSSSSPPSSRDERAGELLLSRDLRSQEVQDETEPAGAQR
jgi:hypothetical protein